MMMPLIHDYNTNHEERGVARRASRTASTSARRGTEARHSPRNETPRLENIAAETRVKVVGLVDGYIHDWSSNRRDGDIPPWHRSDVVFTRILAGNLRLVYLKPPALFRSRLYLDFDYPIVVYNHRPEPSCFSTLDLYRLSPSRDVFSTSFHTSQSQHGVLQERSAHRLRQPQSGEDAPVLFP